MSRIDTRLWLDGHLRQLAAKGVFYTIIHKGNEARGAVALKLNMGRDNGCRVLTQAFDLEGQSGWLPALDGRAVPEAEADSYLQRLISRDDDLWVVEIESRDGSHPFPGKMLD